MSLFSKIEVEGGIALLVVGSISTMAILFMLSKDIDNKIARLEKRVESLEGSAADATDCIEELSRRIDGVQTHFWE
jgi:hypothetical protein